MEGFIQGAYSARTFRFLKGAMIQIFHGKLLPSDLYHMIAQKIRLQDLNYCSFRLLQDLDYFTETRRFLSSFF